MSEQINIYDAKSQLSRLIDRVTSGEEIIIARNGRPVAKLIRYARERAPRTLGLFAGQIQIAEGFDELPEELRQAFEDAE